MVDSSTTNDLASLKAYLDADGGRISDYVAAIEYSYEAKPLIFHTDTSKGAVQVNPEQAFSTMSSAYGSGAFSSFVQMDAFTQLPATRSLYEDAYELKAGHWPQDAHELVLIVDADGVMPDLLEYTLGLKDHAELDAAMADYYSGSGLGRATVSASGAPTSADSAQSTGSRAYTYEELLGIAFSLVPASSLYSYDSEYGVWVDESDNADYMKEAIAQGETLSIAGIVAPKDSDTTILGQGLGYTSELTAEVMATAADSEIVAQQLADPDVDVFTGSTFAELESGEGAKGFDLSSLFAIDASKLQAAFQIDPSKLQADMSALDFSSIDASSLDPSSFDMSGLDLSSIDPSALASSIDLSGLSASELDLSALEAAYPKLAEVDYATVISKVLDEETISPEAAQELASAVSTLAQGFVAYYGEHADTDSDGLPDADAAALARDYMATPEAQTVLGEALSSEGVIDTADLSAKLVTALGEDPAIEAIAEEVSASFASQIGALLAEQMGAALTTQVSQLLSTTLQAAVSNAMGQMMSQVGAAISTQVSQAMTGLASSMATAMSIDESAFAEAFETNMDAESLQKLLSTMMTTIPTTYDANLAALGYGLASDPSQIDVYPTTFADKDEVKAILERYNDDAEAAGEPGRVITYTDMVGLLMSSVTRIIDIIKWMLIAFVSISLVVSSIMIAIITLISVLERKKEIGILRSIGASKRDVSQVFNAETFIVGLLAGLIGVGITLVLALIANAIVEAKLEVHNIAQLPFTAGLVLVAISVLLTLIAGVIPARKAAKEDPVEALRSE